MEIGGKRGCSKKSLEKLEEKTMRNVKSGALHRKKWTAVLLVFSMMVTLCTPVYSKAQDAPAETVPEGYIGIYDIADLYGIRNNLSANYILMKDIDMSKDTA